jgi:glutamyl-tRNA reductase
MASELFVVGLSWRTAPVAVRERLAFPDDELPPALTELVHLPSVGEALLISTCNRVEVYGATRREAPASAVEEATAEVASFLSQSRKVPAEALAEHLYEHTGTGAVGHVFRVAAALDSLVVGEAQILGQLKAAYGVASGAGAAGQILGRCMERAFGVAKRVRSETGIARGAANVSSVAVELAAHVFGDLRGKTVLVVGAGKMSALAARHLRADGAGTLLVTNRSAEKAEALAHEVDGVAKPWDRLQDLLTVADVVISSTGAKQPVLTRPLLKKVMKARRYRPLVLIDIAVPRDVEAKVAKLDGVYLFDIDDLERVVAQNLSERQKEADAAGAIIGDEVSEFVRWLRSQRVVPTIRSLRERFHEVARVEVDKTIKLLERDHTPAEREQALRRLGELIVNKLLHPPMTALRGGDGNEIETLVAAAERLFALQEQASAIGETDLPHPPARAEAAGKNRGSA